MYWRERQRVKWTSLMADPGGGVEQTKGVSGGKEGKRRDKSRRRGYSMERE